MATYYFKSCCDSNTTFIITDFLSPLTGDFYYAQIPNYFTGCTEVVTSDKILPGSPTYLQNSVTLTEFSDCQTCNQTYPCIRVTATSECDVITISPLSISCSADSTTSTITITASGGTPPYTISWSNGFVGPVLNNATPGQNYTITVTDYNWSSGGPDFTATTVCSIPLPTPTPTTTPTPTPTPLPVNSQLLCLFLTKDNVTTGYNFNPTQNYVNGKPTWSSSTYTLQWNLTPQPSWQVTIGSNFFYNTNASSPLGTYTVIGQRASAIVVTGPCGSRKFSFKNITIQRPICEKTPNTGSIFIDTIDAQPPILYSINNGLTTQSSPLFANLNSGTYSVWVQDASSSIITQSVVVPTAQPQTTYSLNFASSIITTNSSNRTLNFTLEVRDSLNNLVTSLPTGTQITFSLSHNNSFGTTILGAGSVSSVISLKKNGVNLGITPTTTVTNSTTPTNNLCGPTQPVKYTTATTKTYSTITFSGTDIITGTLNIQVNQTLPGNVCVLESLDFFTLLSSTITGCSCCSVTARNVNSSIMKTSPNK
jgi:hypothetical protein